MQLQAFTTNHTASTTAPPQILPTMWDVIKAIAIGLISPQGLANDADAHLVCKFHMD